MLRGVTAFLVPAGLPLCHADSVYGQRGKKVESVRKIRAAEMRCNL